jgi:alpha-tubulin suppressor-like RCC1 family protein
MQVTSPFAGAIRSYGGLFTWGDNPKGQLGIGTTFNRSSPVQIGTSSWIAVSAGTGAMAGITATNALFTWGLNTDGALGDGTIIDRSSPVQIGTSSWTAVSAGGGHAGAIRSNGSLFMWGRNNHGALGDGTKVSKSSPVQIGTSSWTAVSAGKFAPGYGASPYNHTIAIRLGGSLFAWGDNTETVGALGDGTTVNKSSPVQIGTNTWSMVSASGDYANEGGTHSIGLTY